jgi:hypothetical protein
MSTAQICPLVSSALGSLIAEISAQASAMASAALTINPGGLTAMAALAASIIASLEAAIAAGVTAPTVSLQLEAALVLKLKLDLLLELQSQMAAGGIHVLAYDGRADDMGAEVSSAVADLPGVQPSDHAYSLVLAATTPAAIDALRTAFL